MSDYIEISIIIPVYNGEHFISRIVQDISENNNSGLNYEIILIDDGSADASFEACSKMARNDCRIRVFKKENGGIASARNYGLSRAKGKYVTFADQDDSIVQGYRNFLRKCENYDLDMLITSPYNRSAGSENMNQRVFHDELITDKGCIKRVAGKLIDGNYFSDNNAQFISTSVWNVIFRREMLIDAGIKFKRFIDYEDDWIFTIESLLASEAVGITSEGYYCWNIHEGSESHTNKYISGLLEKRKKWMKWLRDVLDTLNADEKTIKGFVRNVLEPRNIMMCFNNACWEKGAEKRKILADINLACKEWHVQEVVMKNVEEMDWKNRLLLLLLKCNQAEFAYCLNSKFLKKRFH